jgi:hypothetical protein
MSVSFIAKNLAGDLFHLSYDSSRKAKKQLAFLRSLLHRTFDAPRGAEVVWFVEEEAFKLPAEGQTMEVLFREPYSVRVSLVDEPSQTNMTVVEFVHRSPTLWSRDQITRWVSELDFFRDSLEEGNSAPSYHGEDEWLIEELYAFLQVTRKILHESNANRPDSEEALLEIQEADRHGMKFPDTLHLYLAFGSHTFVSPVFLADGCGLDAARILLALEEDNMLIRPQE